MPIKKHANRKHMTALENRATIPTKEKAWLKTRLQIALTGKELQKHRVTSLGTARKKRRPKKERS